MGEAVRVAADVELAREATSRAPKTLSMSPPPSAGGAVVRPDAGAVDHLQQVSVTAAIGQGFQHHVPQSGRGPAPELAEHRVPVAELGWQVTPRRAGTRDPEDGVQHPPVVAGRPAAERAGRHHEGFEKGPLLVRQQPADQRRSPCQRSVWNHARDRLGIPRSPVCPRCLAVSSTPGRPKRCLRPSAEFRLWRSRFVPTWKRSACFNVGAHPGSDPGRHRGARRPIEMGRAPHTEVFFFSNYGLRAGCVRTGASRRFAEAVFVLRLSASVPNRSSQQVRRERAFGKRLYRSLGAGSVNSSAPKTPGNLPLSAAAGLAESTARMGTGGGDGIRTHETT